MTREEKKNCPTCGHEPKNLQGGISCSQFCGGTLYRPKTLEGHITIQEWEEKTGKEFPPDKRVYHQFREGCPITSVTLDCCYMYQNKGNLYTEEKN